MFSHRVTAPLATARLRVWAKPASRRVEIRWDPWRDRWTVAVTAPAVRGEANRAILSAIAERLGVPESAVRWVRAGASAAKEAEVSGLGAAEVERRMRGGRALRTEEGAAGRR